MSESAMPQLPSRFAFFPKLAAIQAGKAKDMPMTRAELQGLAMVIAADPAAQRVHAADERLHLFVERVIEVDGELNQLVKDGEITQTQAGRFREMSGWVKALDAREGGAVPPKEERSKGFEFLWSDALENDDQWHAARLSARAAFSAMRADDDPWIG